MQFFFFFLNKELTSKFFMASTKSLIFLPLQSHSSVSDGLSHAKGIGLGGIFVNNIFL